MTEKNSLQNGKKFKRKIRIRLADPNIADSYVCEIFDSSFENDESDFIEISPCTKPKEDSQPKNYFEILMSKESRMQLNCKSGNENENFPVETKLRISSDGENDKRKMVKKRKLNRPKSKDILTPLTTNSEKEFECESDSSEDETLFEVQRKCKFNNNIAKPFNYGSSPVSSETKSSEVKIQNQLSASKMFNSSKIEDSFKKKSQNILNYFSKVDIVSKTKLSTKGTLKKVKEIIDVEESISCQKSDEEVVVMEHLEKNLNETDKRKFVTSAQEKDVKLAPIFQKKSNRVIDVVAQKARFEFLHRETPRLLKKTDSLKNIENVIAFPAISHVQQRNDSICWCRREISFPFPLLPYTDQSTFINKKKFRFSINNVAPVQINNSIVSNAIDVNEDCLVEIKKKYVNLNLNSIIDGLKEKRDKFVNRLRNMNKPRNLKRSCDVKKTNDDLVSEDFNTLWTDKYRPTSNEILGNENVVKTLRNWLQSWKKFDEELKALTKSGQKLNRNERNNGKDDDDDDDDYGFFESDEENYDLKVPENVCLLYGPNGCGKTSLISALANELEFGVLEVNASSNRTGKKVLSSLQEATQSHKVHLNLNQKETFVKKVRKKKSNKNKKKIENSVKTVNRASDCKISLIVVEDADIVFEEHDEGFFSAMASLVQTSKRPIIFVTNDPACVHLYNFKSGSLILEMELPNFYSSCAVVDAVSSLEGVRLDKKVLESLVRESGFDLRKCLSELQFWVQCGENSVTLPETIDLGQLWRGLSKFLYQENIKLFMKASGFKRKRFNDLYDSSSEDEIAKKKVKLNSDKVNSSSCTFPSPVTGKFDSTIYSYSSVLDLVSTLDTFRLSCNEEPIPVIEYKQKDSLSLEENMEDVSWADTNLSEKIFSESVDLFSRVFTKSLKGKEDRENKINFVSASWEEFRWRKSREEASKELSELVPLHNLTDKRSVHVDYLPMIRNICRLEKNRMLANNKRKNRFYHYLNNLGVEPTEENLEINCQVLDFNAINL